MGRYGMGKVNHTPPPGKPRGGIELEKGMGRFRAGKVKHTHAIFLTVVQAMVTVMDG